MQIEELAEVVCQVCGDDKLEITQNNMIICLGCKSEVKRHSDNKDPSNYLEVAVDPGLSGGIAVRDEKGAVTSFPMPATEGDICSNLQAIRQVAQVSNVRAVAYVEDLPYYTGRNLPGSAVGKMFRNFGFVLGSLQAMAFEIYMIKPQRWQKLLAMGTKGDLTNTQWKNKLKSEAQRRFPQLGSSITLKTADALLILEAGGRLL